MKLRVGLIGLGNVWLTHQRPALRALADRFEVRAIYEQIGHRAQTAAEEFQASVVHGYRAIVQREDIDAVLIFAPQWAKVLPVLAACKAHKAVYCYTGLELEPEEAQAVQQQVEEAGIAFMVAFPRRQAPATLRLKELLATSLGAPRLLFCHQRHDNHQTTNHVTDKTLEGLPMPELIDWCCYIVGHNPISVLGLRHAETDTLSRCDYQMLSLDFSERGHPGTGTIAQLSCGRYIPPQWKEAIEYRAQPSLQVSCERGLAFVDLPSSLVWFDKNGQHQESLEEERSIDEQLLVQFHHAAVGSTPKKNDMENAFRAAHIVRQAVRSYREGRRVDL